jgi:poly-gamma-glutamate system protein
LSWRLDNRRRFILLLLAAGALLLQFMLDSTRTPMRQKDHDLKLQAAQLADRAFTALRLHRGLDTARLDLVNDPAGTGLIGPEFSLITNARGDLDAKLTSLNPNFAGLFVEYFRTAGLQPGDPVAVAISGSFPGLNIGLYAALQTLQLEPVVITSVGASMWGANNPDFTWLDMEKHLVDHGFFTIKSAAATYGGGDDMGRGLSPDGRRLLQEALDRNQVPLLESTSIEDAIVRRESFFLEQTFGRSLGAYVNIGGGVASIGSSHNRLLLPTGLSFSLGAHNWPRKGNLIRFAERGVPVIHMLRVVDLARKNGLPVSPDFRPLPGEGDIFTRQMYRLPLAIAALLVYCLVLVLTLAPEIRQGLFDRLTRLPGARTQVLVFLLVLASGQQAQAASRWVAVAPEKEVEKTCLQDAGNRFTYRTLDEKTATVYEISGPRDLKIVSRYLFAAGDPESVPFTITCTVDGQEKVRKTFRARRHEGMTTCDLDEIASHLHRVLTKVPGGKHEVGLTASAEGSGKVVVRLFRKTLKKATGTVPFQPAGYAEIATIQFASGSQSKYYRFVENTPLEFSLTGPTTLKIHTRLDFDETMNGTQDYGLEVLRDGEPYRTFQFHTDKLSTAVYLERPDILPGERKTISLEVPRGHHNFTMRCLRPTRCGVAARIRIPRKDLENKR